MPPTAAEKTWETCLTQISDQISTQSFRTWFAPITPLAIERNDEAARLRLAVPDAFHTEWLESHYAQVIRKAATDVLGQQADITYEITPAESASEPDLFSTPATHAPGTIPETPRPNRSNTPTHRVAPAEGRATWTPVPRSAPPQQTSSNARSFPKERAFPDDGAFPNGRAFPNASSSPNARSSPGAGSSPLNRQPVPTVDSRLKPEYSFESFIEGDCNRLARSAAVAISHDPGGTSFNPFMVYGGVGLGKTHIVQAIGNHVTKGDRTRHVLYVSSEQFTSQFVRSIQENRASDFSNFYRQIDLLIVDDVQFFGGKEKTQEEFFHIFNELHQTGKQIILCADRPPSEISGIEERLLSRFNWGLSADIQPPDLETRIAILQHKAAQHGVSLHPEIVDFVAERVRANIRQLEGALLKLSAHAELENRTIDLEAAKEILRDMVDDYQVRLEIEDIQRSVAQYYGQPPEALSAKTRKREVVTARHVAMYFSKLLTTHSLKSIGLRFGGRDHSTVIHACNTIENRIDVEPAFREDVEEIAQRLERHGPAKSSRRHHGQIGIA